MAHDIIQLRRSALDLKSTDDTVKNKINSTRLEVGEAQYFYANNNDYLIIGNNENQNNTDLKRFKAFNKEIVDRQVFFDSNNLKDESGNTINPTTVAANVTCTDGETPSTVQSMLTSLKSTTTTNTNNITGLQTSVTNLSTKTGATEKNATQLFITGVEAANGQLYYNNAIKVTANNVLTGAAWNDFAEFRKCKEEAGTVVVEVGDGSLEKSYDRLQKGAAIVSDTYGMVIGPEGDDYKPIAVAGRVLVNTFERDLLKAGDAVCTDEYGGVSKMKWWEVILHPDCILGYVSEIPTYPVWNGVLVENRIWVKVK